LLRAFIRLPEYEFRDTENEPLYRFLAHHEITAICTYPESARA
jgi:hypothetical protein